MRDSGSCSVKVLHKNFNSLLLGFKNYEFRAPGKESKFDYHWGRMCSNSSRNKLFGNYLLLNNLVKGQKLMSEIS